MNQKLPVKTQFLFTNFVKNEKIQTIGEKNSFDEFFSFFYMNCFINIYLEELQTKQMIFFKKKNNFIIT